MKQEDLRLGLPVRFVDDPDAGVYVVAEIRPSGLVRGENLICRGIS